MLSASSLNEVEANSMALFPNQTEPQPQDTAQQMPVTTVTTGTTSTNEEASRGEFAHFASWSEIRKETEIPVNVGVDGGCGCDFGGYDNSNNLGERAVSSDFVDLSSEEVGSAYLLHEVPGNVACCRASDAASPGMGAVAQNAIASAPGSKANVNTGATAATATGESPNIPVLYKNFAECLPNPPVDTEEPVDDVHARLMHTFSHFSLHRSRSSAAQHQRRLQEEQAVKSKTISNAEQTTSASPGAQIAFDPAMYSTPVDLSQSNLACSALHTLQCFARRIAESQVQSGSLSGKNAVIPKIIIDLASAAIVQTDNWLPSGSSDSLDSTVAPFLDLFDACDALWNTEIDLMRAPLPWPDPSNVLEWSKWKRAVSWLYEWCSQIDALLSHVRTSLAEVPPHTHCWRWGKIELPCVHDVEPYPPFSTNVASTGVPLPQEIAPPPCDGIFSQVPVKIGPNSTIPDLIAASNRYSCRISNVLNKLHNQTSAAVGVKLISDECAHLREMVSQLEDTLEILPDHAHLLVHNGMNVQKVAFTMKTLFIGHGYMCKSREPYLGNTSTRAPVEVEYKDIRQTIIHIHQFHRDHPYLPEHTHSLVLVPKDPTQQPEQYTSLLFLGGRRSVGHCITQTPLEKPTF